MTVAPVNVQAGLFITDPPSTPRRRWRLYDDTGALHVDTNDLGAVAVAADRLAATTGHAFVVADDNAIAHITPGGLNTNAPDAGWTRTLTQRKANQ